MKRLMFAGIATLLLTTAAHATTLLTLSPSNGAIAGLPGATAGWGFTFLNDTDYAVITGSEFCATSSSPLPGACAPVVPNLGTYTDVVGPQPLLVIGPSPEQTTVSQAFDATAHTGLGSFTFDPLASGGASASGLIAVTYDLFSVSPNDPNFSPSDEIAGGNFVTADASVTAVPEPGALLLLGSGLAGLGLWRNRRTRA
jgi:hypothetical protein